MSQLLYGKPVAPLMAPCGPRPHARHGRTFRTTLAAQASFMGGNSSRSPAANAHREKHAATHPCHGGPAYGVVVRELHAASPVFGRRLPHLHAACAFAAHHRWKLVEEYLRERLQIKVLGSNNAASLNSPFTKINGQFWVEFDRFLYKKTILL